MSKPAVSSKITGKSLAPFGPAYGFREGSGTSAADDAGIAPAGALQGNAAWASTAAGPVIRTAAQGDCVRFAFNEAFTPNTPELTILVGVTPGPFSGTASSPSAYLNQQYGYDSANYGIWNVGVDGAPGRVRGIICGIGTSDTDLAIAEGTAYILVLRGRKNEPVRFQAFDRWSGQQVGVDQLSADLLYNGGILQASSNPVYLGRYVRGADPRDAPGDYEFFFMTPNYLSDAQVAAFVANPYAIYAASSAPKFAVSPATATAGTPVTVTATGTNTAWSSGTTFSVTGGTGASISGLSVNVGAQTATFTFNPGTAAATLTIADSADAATATFAAQPAFDWLAAFESTMQWCATGQPNAYPQKSGYFADGDDHYDVLGVFEQVRAYTGSGSWDAQVAAGLDHYREQGVYQFGGYVQGNHTYADGLLAHYERTGDVDSRTAAVLVSFNSAFGGDPVNATYLYEQASSREVAFSIQARLAADSLGCAHRVGTETLVGLALGHIAQWTAPANQRLWMTFTRPFMVGLTMEALIKYWDRYRAAPDTGPGSPGNLAAQVPAAIKAACDWLWANTWQAVGNSDFDGNPWPYGGFQYTFEDLRTKFNPVPSATTSVAGKSKFCGGPGLSTQDDFYKYAPVQFTSGPLNGQVAICSGYTGSTREFRFDFAYGFSAAPGVGDTFQVLYTAYPPASGTSTMGASAGSAVDTLVAPALNPLIAPAYAWLGLRLGDPAYLAKFATIMSGSYALRANPGTQKVYNQTYKWSIKGLRWYQRAAAEYPAATALTLSGPASAARVNAMSDRFTVALSGASGTQFSVISPVTITPSDGGAGGSFLPSTALLTTDRPKATFRYRPATSRANPIAVANDRSLTNPAAVSYTPSGTAPIATAIVSTLDSASGPASPPVGLTYRFDPPNAVAPASADVTGGVFLMAVAPSNGGQVSYSTYGPMYGNQAAWLSGDRPALAMKLNLPSNATGNCVVTTYLGFLPSPVTTNYAIGSPKVLSATIDKTGTLLTLNFSSSVIGDTGFTLSGGHSLGTSSGSAQSRTYQVSPVAIQNEALTLAYTRGNVADATNSGIGLDGFSGFVVVNQSIIQKPDPPAPPKFPPLVPRHRNPPRPFKGF